MWAYVRVCLLYENGSGLNRYYALIPSKSNYDTWYFKRCLGGQNDPLKMVKLIYVLYIREYLALFRTHVIMRYDCLLT